MRTLQLLDTLDDYDSSLTLEQDDASSLLLVIANASVKAMLRPARRATGGDESYGSELTLTPQTIPIFGVNGVQLKSAEAGNPARIIAVLAAAEDPQLTAGIPFLQHLSAGGQVDVEGELAYAEFVSPVSITASTEAAATVIVTAPAITVEAGTRLKLEFFCPEVAASAAATAGVFFENGVAIGQVRLPSTSSVFAHVALYRTPGEGTFTYSFRAFRVSGTPIAEGGPGGAGEWVSGFIRVSTAPQ